MNRVFYVQAHENTNRKYILSQTQLHIKYRKATAAKALWERTCEEVQDDPDGISGQEDVLRVFMRPHSCTESICAVQSKCQLFGCCQSFSRRVA